MLGLTGANRIWFIPDIHDMRLGKYRLLDSVKGVFPNPYNGDVFASMSSDKKKLKLVRYYGHKHILWDISYDRGYKFMRPVYVEDSNLGESKGNASDAGIGDSKNGQESSLDMTKVKSEKLNTKRGSRGPYTTMEAASVVLKKT